MESDKREKGQRKRRKRAQLKSVEVYSESQEDRQRVEEGLRILARMIAQAYTRDRAQGRNKTGGGDDPNDTEK